MLNRHFGLVCAFLVSGSALGAVASLEYDHSFVGVPIAEIRAAVPAGDSVHTIHLRQTESQGLISIWHEQSPTCQGFDIAAAKSRGDQFGDPWLNMEFAVVNGLRQIRSRGEFKTISLLARNHTGAAQFCKIIVKKEGADLPSDVTFLAKIKTPSCTTSDDPRVPPVCHYSVEELAGEQPKTFVITERDYNNFQLKANEIYRLTGYTESIGDYTVLRIQRAVRVQ